jgi:hypothetical protein
VIAAALSNHAASCMNQTVQPVPADAASPEAKIQIMQPKTLLPCFFHTIKTAAAFSAAAPILPLPG